MEFTSLKNYPIDLVVIALVLLAGLFQKKYLDAFKLNGAWKTLICSAGFTIVYALLVNIAGNYTKDMPVKWFFSYVVGTSLYELLFKKFISSFFPDENVLKLIIFFIISIPCMSCNTVKKNSSTSKAAATIIKQSHVDSKGISNTYFDYGALADSASLKSNNHSNKKELSLWFASDTGDYASPVTIEHTTCKTIINPGGRKLIALNIESDSSNAIVDSAHVTNQQVVSFSTKDSTAIQHTTITDSSVRAQQSQFVKNTFRFAGMSLGFMFSMIALVVCGIIYLRNNTQLLKK